MGLSDWRKSRKVQDDETTQVSEGSNEMAETLAPPTPGFYPSGLTTPGSNGGSGHSTPQGRLSHRPSFSGRVSLAGSTRSLQSSMMEDIKHEVMVNYLFQQQCSALWVGDGSGQLEGVMLRKAKGFYMSCPPQLVDSPFGLACAALNVQVSKEDRIHGGRPLNITRSP